MGTCKHARPFNTLAQTGITFGLISPKDQALDVLPILGIVFSTLGLISFDSRMRKMRRMASFERALSMVVALPAFR